ncbi:MAG: crosslink repair DNA glycosylase YcaQ family protein [Ilumatobacteraceae bacterium]
MRAATARRIALAAQGFADPRPSGRVDRRHLRRVLDRVGLIQIDSVNVLVRSQELPLFARLGDHPRSLIPAASADGELFEYWGHEASHIPTEHHHLYRFKMAAAARGELWKALARLNAERPDFVESIVERIASDGPIVAGDLQMRRGPKGTWWDWDHGKMALEYLFWCGRLTARRRATDFARVYDLPERMIPAEHLDRPTRSEDEQRAGLLLQAARAMGVATARDLAVYHRQKPKAVAHLLTELVEDGRLVPTEVEGWRDVAYLHPDAKTPRRIDAATFVSPFDSICWERDRLERVFGFQYRIEIYTPQPKRVYGYYVLPFLYGDSFVARADLKADRATGTLRAHGVFAEPGIPTDDVAEAIASELTSMARWLGLDRVALGGRGDLDVAVAAHLG